MTSSGTAFFKSLVIFSVITCIAAAIAYRSVQTFDLRICLLTFLSALMFWATVAAAKRKARKVAADLERARDERIERDSLRRDAHRYIAEINAEIATLDPKKDTVSAARKLFASITNTLAEATDKAINVASIVGSVGLGLYGNVNHSTAATLGGHLLGEAGQLSVGRLKNPVTRLEHLTDLLHYHDQRIRTLTEEIQALESVISDLENRLVEAVEAARRWKRYWWPLILILAVTAWALLFHACESALECPRLPF